MTMAFFAVAFSPLLLSRLDRGTCLYVKWRFHGCCSNSSCFRSYPLSQMSLPVYAVIRATFGDGTVTIYDRNSRYGTMSDLE